MKRLIFSAFVLLVAAVMLGTTTYAWFSMNTQVSVTGMQVVAKSDDTFLLIGMGNDDTADEIQAAGNLSLNLNVTDSEAKVYPSSPALTSTEASYLTVAQGHNKVGGGAITTAGVQVTNASTASAVTNWFTANATDVGSADILVSSVKQLTSFSGYVITRTVYLTVADGSNDANNLSVSATFTQKTGGNDISAVKVLIATDDGGFAVLSSASASADIKGNNTAITDTTVRTINIYIFYDGDEAPVYTNNMANLTGAEIDIVFDVEAVPAA